MSYEPLHHKYRPQKFSDLVGQNAISATLTNAILNKRIAPAYLFTGPRGTGKTSSARILAKSLNCFNSSEPTPDPCGSCEVCISIARGTALDVIEIDAASNTGVDNIREIIERAQLSPVQSRYKVYVIDECHMLSSAAFNALLKTLEEPPDRVIFVLATTDPQRVLPTIISRCQRFDYRRIPLADMVGHLSKIAQLEKIDIEISAITLVAQLSNGGLRDAESLLDQLGLFSDRVSPEKVWDLVGIVSEGDLFYLVQAIKNQQPEAVLEKSRLLLDRGREPLIVLQNLTNFYLSLLIAKTAPNRNDLVSVTPPVWSALKEEAKRWNSAEIIRGQQLLKQCETQLKNTAQPRLWLEVTLMGLLESQIVAPQTSSVSAPVSSVVQTLNVPENNFASAPIQIQSVTNSNLNSEAEVKVVKSREAEVIVSSNFASADIWQKVLKNLSPPTTQSLVTQQCNLVSLDENTAEIAVSSEQIYKYHQSKLNNLVEAFAVVCQRKIKVNFHIGNKKQSSIVPALGRVNSSPIYANNSVEPEKSPSPAKTEKEIFKDIIPTKLAEQDLPDTKSFDNQNLNAQKFAQIIAKNFEGQIIDATSKESSPTMFEPDA